jgi:lipopolysaccharide transport system permease protein
MSTSSPLSAGGIQFPEKIIAPRHGWLAINWAEIWRFRELLYFLAWRDIKLRYKQTVLGLLWAFLQPFLKLVVFSVVFGGMAKMDSQGFPYPVFLYAGLLPWQFFQEALSRSSQSLVAGSNLISKVYFPRLLIPLSSVGGCLVDFGISFLILVGLMFHYDMAPTWATLAVLPLVGMTILTALAAGMLFGALNLAYRDFRYVVPFVVQLGLFVTPVIYPVRLVPEAYQWVMCLNPMAGLIGGYRAAILGLPFEALHLAVSAATATLLFLFALYYFRRLESRFADIV